MRAVLNKSLKCGAPNASFAGGSLPNRSRRTCESRAVLVHADAHAALAVERGSTVQYAGIVDHWVNRDVRLAILVKGQTDRRQFRA